MYKCKECQRTFEEPKQVRSSYENYYGVSSLFERIYPMILQLCPYCNSEEFNEIDEIDEDQVEEE